MKQVLAFIVSIIFCILCATQQTFAERYIPNAQHPDFPGKCYHKETNHAFDVDTEYRPKGICEKYYCRDDFIIRVNFCTRYNVPGGCRPVAGNKNESFPACCPKLLCNDIDGNTVLRETTAD